MNNVIVKKYHYTECGLDNIYLLNGYEISKLDNGEEEIFIHDIHGLHRSIGLALISKQGSLSGNEIKFIRTTLDLSQTMLSKIFGCTYQTILLWEKNRQPISKAADLLLRALFFSYLNPKGNQTIYKLINEIADIDSEISSAHKKIDKILFKEEFNEWKRAA